MGGKCCEKKQSPHFSWTLFFSGSGKKQSPGEVGTLFFFTAFPSHVWDSVFFRAENFWTPLSVTSSYMLEPGFWIWLPGILWHYNLHHTKFFKDFAPKKSNLRADILKVDFFSRSNFRLKKNCARKCTKNS